MATGTELVRLHEAVVVAALELEAAASADQHTAHRPLLFALLDAAHAYHCAVEVAVPTTRADAGARLGQLDALVRALGEERDHLRAENAALREETAAVPGQSRERGRCGDVAVHAREARMKSGREQARDAVIAAARGLHAALFVPGPMPESAEAKLALMMEGFGRQEIRAAILADALATLDAIQEINR
jgi:hypothetical protein